MIIDELNDQTIKYVTEALDLALYELSERMENQKVDNYHLVNKIIKQIIKFDNNFVNFISTLRVFQRSGYNGKVAVNPAYPKYYSQLKEIIKGLNLENKLEVMESSHPDIYLKNVANCKVFLSMDLRYTCGRFQTDALAIGSIAVGTASQGQYMFLEYMVNGKEIIKANELITKAINDNTDYSEMQRYFSYDFFKQKLYKDMELL